MARFAEAGHRIHSAIGVLMTRQPPLALSQPRHLAVAATLQRVELEGLVDLLVERGLITQAAFRQAIGAVAEREASRLEREVAGRSGYTG